MGEHPRATSRLLQRSSLIAPIKGHYNLLSWATSLVTRSLFSDNVFLPCDMKVDLPPVGNANWGEENKIRDHRIHYDTIYWRFVGLWTISVLKSDQRYKPRLKDGRFKCKWDPTGKMLLRPSRILLQVQCLSGPSRGGENRCFISVAFSQVCAPSCLGTQAIAWKDETDLGSVLNMNYGTGPVNIVLSQRTL